jgi:hypothetical protein
MLNGLCLPASINNQYTSLQTCPEANLIYTVPPVTLSPKMIPGCVKLIIKANQDKDPWNIFTLSFCCLSEIQTQLGLKSFFNLVVSPLRNAMGKGEMMFL